MLVDSASEFLHDEKFESTRRCSLLLMKFNELH